MNGLVKSYAEVLAAIGPRSAHSGSKSELAGRGEMNLQQGQGAPRLAPKEGLMERCRARGFS